MLVLVSVEHTQSPVGPLLVLVSVGHTQSPVGPLLVLVSVGHTQSPVGDVVVADGQEVCFAAIEAAGAATANIAPAISAARKYFLIVTGLS